MTESLRLEEENLFKLKKLNYTAFKDIRNLFGLKRLI